MAIRVSQKLAQRELDPDRNFTRARFGDASRLFNAFARVSVLNLMWSRKIRLYGVRKAFY
jgi:hypothetical protein